MYKNEKFDNLLGLILSLIVIAAALVGCFVLFTGLKHTAGSGGSSIVAEGSGESETDSTQPQKDESILSAISNMTLEQKVAQLFMVTPDSLTGTTGATIVGAATQTAYSAYPVGGILFESGNVQSDSQITDMVSGYSDLSVAAVGCVPFLAVSEEGGSTSVIARGAGLDVESTSDMSVIGATGDDDEAYTAYSTIGAYLKKLGFNVDLAPVADIYSNKSNTEIAVRSFGSDADTVSSMVSASVKGLRENDILSALSHFPGIGSVSGSTAERASAIERTKAELTAEELLPFTSGIDSGAAFVVVSHASCEAVTGDTAPASLSSAVVTEWLRTELGYDGIIMTDAMNKTVITENYNASEAAIKAIQAGCDMILRPSSLSDAYNGLLNAVRNDVISEDRIDESLYRILLAKKNL